MTVVEWSDKVRETVETLIRDEFGPAMPSVEIVYENTRRDHPKQAPWIYVTIQEGKVFRANIGNAAQFSGVGAVNVQVMVPENSGTKTMRQIGDLLFHILADRQVALAGIGSLTFCDVEKRYRQPVNGWQSISIQVAYNARFSIDRPSL